MGAVLLALGCGAAEPGLRSVRPDRQGQAVVLLVGSPVGFVPLACHDPLWDSIRGAADCADLIPPGAQIRSEAGTVHLGERAPFECAWSPAVGFAVPGARGFAVWPADSETTIEAISPEPLPSPPPWPAHTTSGWRAEIADLGWVWSLDLGGFSGLFFGQDPVVVDHFVDPPQLLGHVDLDADGTPELLLRIGATLAVYRADNERLDGVAGCRIE